MTNFKGTWQVAKWEFNRFYKIKDEIKGLFYMIVFGALGFFAVTWITSSPEEMRSVHLISNDYISAEELQTERLLVSTISSNELAISRESLDNGEINAILIPESPFEIQLITARDGVWLEMLRSRISELTIAHRLASVNLDSNDWEKLQAGINWQVDELRASPESRRAESIAAIVIIGLLFMSVFLGFAYQFTAITGEKTSRMTEMMLSVITPQMWIDGKILGITLLGLVKVCLYSGLSVFGLLLLSYFFGTDWIAYLSFLNLGHILVFLILALLGILMWNAFLAGVASTIDDPNSSERAALMFFPLLPVMIAALALINPNSLPMVILGMFPITSPAVLPARMILTDVAWWEVAVAVVLLAFTVHVFRIVAGKIFATAMLMYGKEPSFKELWQWVKKA